MVMRASSSHLGRHGRSRRRADRSRERRGPLRVLHQNWLVLGPSHEPPRTSTRHADRPRPECQQVQNEPARSTSETGTAAPHSITVIVPFRSSICGTTASKMRRARCGMRHNAARYDGACQFINAPSRGAASASRPAPGRQCASIVVASNRGPALRTVQLHFDGGEHRRSRSPREGRHWPCPVIMKGSFQNPKPAVSAQPGCCLRPSAIPWEKRAPAPQAQRCRQRRSRRARP